MTQTSKRALLKIAGWSTLAAVTALVGCGKKEEAAPPAASAPVAAASAPAPKPEPLKIAFAYVGPVGDGGWTFAHDNARKAVEKEFGVRFHIIRGDWSERQRAAKDSIAALLRAGS